MPTRTRHSRLPTALLLLGAVGLLASGVGAFPGAPAWAWLVVLGIGAGLPHLDARGAAVRRVLKAAKALAARQDAAEKRLSGLLTPEQAALLVQQHNAMALDMTDLKVKVAELDEAERARKFGTAFGGGR